VPWTGVVACKGRLSFGSLSVLDHISSLVRSCHSRATLDRSQRLGWKCCEAEELSTYAAVKIVSVCLLRRLLLHIRLLVSSAGQYPCAWLTWPTIGKQTHLEHLFDAVGVSTDASAMSGSSMATAGNISLSSLSSWYWDTSQDFTANARYCILLVDAMKDTSDQLKPVRRSRCSFPRRPIHLRTAIDQR
jgi:hypothetical protein